MLSKRQTAIGAAILSAATLPMLNACGPSSNPPPQATPITATSSATSVSELGMGIYVVPHNRSWPEALVNFCKDHPRLEITSLYSAEEGGNGWTNSVVIMTKEHSSAVQHEFFTLPHDARWPESLVHFRKENPDKEITASYAADEGGGGWTNSVVIVTKPN